VSASVGCRHATANLWGMMVSRRLNKQIAHELGTSERTIKLYRVQMMRKMEAESPADLMKQTGKVRPLG
jgi:FixJ family two-component response regulator